MSSYPYWPINYWAHERVTDASLAVAIVSSGDISAEVGASESLSIAVLATGALAASVDVTGSLSVTIITTAEIDAEVAN